MSDLLGSILDNMKPPPSTVNKDALKRRKELKRKFEEENKKRAERVKEIEKQVEKFALGTDKEFNFEPSEKEWRAIQHEIAEIAGVISISCYNGQNKEKHVVLFKKESCPGEEELKKRRLGEKYIEGFSRTRPQTSPSKTRSKNSKTPFIPSRNYQDKYKKILNTAEVTRDDRQFHGLVPVHMLCSEPKSIEDSLNEIREKKKLKTGHSSGTTDESGDN
ncbi:hypothetical protein ACHWQZ_G014333 [Mnemiopsis leidyi]